jgi:hypothetical protein
LGGAEPRAICHAINKAPAHRNRVDIKKNGAKPTSAKRITRYVEPQISHVAARQLRISGENGPGREAIRWWAKIYGSGCRVVLNRKRLLKSVRSPAFFPATGWSRADKGLFHFHASDATSPKMRSSCGIPISPG